MIDYINRVISNEIDNINAPDLERDLIYKLLNIERRLSNTGKIKYMEDYRRALEDASGAGHK